MIAAHLPRLGTALLAGFTVLVVVMSWWQVAVAASLEARPDNPALIAAHQLVSTFGTTPSASENTSTKSDRLGSNQTMLPQKGDPCSA